MWQDVALTYLEYLKTTLPLPWFVFFGSLLEEIVSPIPSSVVQIGVGTLAQNQLYPWYGVVALGIVGAIGNTLGSLWAYGIYRLIGKWIVAKLGRYIGLDQTKIDRAKEFMQKGARDDIAIFLLRALPFVPIINPSVISGILAIKFSTFLISTFIGYTVRNTYMLTVGFVGMDAVLRGDPRAISLLVVIFVIVVLMIMVSHRHAKHATEQDQIVDES